MKHKYAKWLALLCTLALALSMVPAALAAPGEGAGDTPAAPTEPTPPTHEITVEGAAPNAGGYYDLDFGTVVYNDKLGEVTKSFTIKVASIEKTPAKAADEVMVTVSAVTGSNFEVKQVGEAKKAEELEKAQKVPEGGLVVVVALKDSEPNGEKDFHQNTLTISSEKAATVTVKPKVVVAKATLPNDLVVVENVAAKDAKDLKITSTQSNVSIVKKVNEKADGIHVNSEKKNKLFGNGNDVTLKFAAVEKGKVPTKETTWQNNETSVQVSKKGAYNLYYKIEGGKYYKDSDPVVVSEVGDIKVTDTKISVPLVGGDHELPKTSAETDLDGKIDTTTLPMYDTSLKFKVAGWYTDAGFTSKYAGDGKLNEKSALYAKWEEKEIKTKEVKITFKYDDEKGTIDNGKCLVEDTTDSPFLGQLTHDKPDPTTKTKKENGKDVVYNFAGWMLNGEAIKQGTKITEGAELVAKWEKAETTVKPATEKEVKVSYVVDDKATEGTATVKVADNTLVKLNVANPTKAGYTFAGWTTDAEGKNAVAVGKTAVTEGMKLYAQFTKNSTPGTSTPSVNVPTQTPVVPSTKPSGSYTAEGWTATTGGFTHKEPDGTLSKGSRWIEVNGVGHRYVFDNNGILVTKAGQAAAGITSVTADGDILMNGNLYYLNPARSESDPRTCYVMTNYLRTRANYGDQTYYDQDGITFEGWMKNAEGGLRYQTRLDGTPIDRYLIVWRAQILPQCQHPDYPGDASHMLAAGKYFFDDDGVLVTKEGWNDGKDGKEYYTNAQGAVTQERAK